MLDNTLKQYQNATFADYSKENLVDICNINICTNKPIQERLIEFLEQIKNPYLFKVGETKVKIRFNSENTFTNALETAILNSINF